MEVHPWRTVSVASYTPCAPTSESTKRRYLSPVLATPPLTNVFAVSGAMTTPELRCLVPASLRARCKATARSSMDARAWDFAWIFRKDPTARDDVMPTSATTIRSSIRVTTRMEARPRMICVRWPIFSLSHFPGHSAKSAHTPHHLLYRDTQPGD